MAGSIVDPPWPSPTSGLPYRPGSSMTRATLDPNVSAPTSTTVITNNPR